MTGVKAGSAVAGSRWPRAKQDRPRPSPNPHDIFEDLRAADARLVRIVDAYQEVNLAVNRAQTCEDHLEQTAEAELRKKRVVLKDVITRRLGV